MDIVNKLYNLIGNGYITTSIISLIPMFELKGGILFARANGLNFFEALAFAFLGSTLVFFVIFFLLKPIIALLKRIKVFNNFAITVENYFSNKAKKVLLSKGNEQGEDRVANIIKMLAVFIFVALPLPLTGVYTGTAIAVFLNMDFGKAFISVATGNAVAGIIISILAQLFYNYVNYIIYGFTALVVISIVILIVKIVLSKPKDIKENEKE